MWRLDHDFCSTSEMLLIPGAITLSLPSRHRNLSLMSFRTFLPGKRWDISDPSSLPGGKGVIFLLLIQDPPGFVDGSTLVFGKIC